MKRNLPISVHWLVVLIVLAGAISLSESATPDAESANRVTPADSSFRIFLPLVKKDDGSAASPTSTATASLTPTPTNTSTVTSTGTSTSTRTATATSTPSATATPTKTATSTATPTSTRTPTSTSTPTATATSSATATATSTSTATATATVTATATLPAPTLIAPADGSLWAKVRFDWTDVNGAVGYVIQLSTMQAFNTIAYEQFVQESEYTLKSTLSGTYYWRVYATQTMPFMTLLVDDDDNVPDVRGTYSSALEGIGASYVVWDTLNSDTEPSDSQLAPYSAVIWFTGDEFGGFAGPGSAGETALGSFLDDGKCLLMSSQDYLYDRGLTPFMANYLGLASGSSDVGQISVAGTGAVFSGLGPYSLSYPFTNYSDLLAPGATAETAFTGDKGSAAVDKSDGAARTAFLGFPIEALPESADRQEVLERFLSWCGWSQGIGGAGDRRLVHQGIAHSATRSIHLVVYDADDDGDALRNGWELHGYDAGEDGTIDVNLPALGADYRHKDIFVEMDYMVRASATNGLGPNQYVLNETVASFLEAPVPNPDGVTGIDIHLDLDDEVPYDDDLNPVTTQFNAIKAVYFETVRTPIYHYMIWANKYSGGSSSGLSFGLPATSFIVTLGAWEGGNGGTDPQKIGTFIHELGHNLGLHHGGNDDLNYKPNYLSIMSYSFQISGVYRNGSWYNYDYQRFDLPSLNELSLNEPVGLNGSAQVAGYGTAYVCPDGTGRSALPADGAINWNCDGDATDAGITVNINGDTSGGLPIYGVLGSYNDWPNIVFDGGGAIGSGLAPEALAQIVSSLEVPPDIEELTYEQQLIIDQWTAPRGAP